MTSTAGGSRRYSSAVRAEQRLATRRRVLDAARTLFLRRGFTGTTVEAMAGRAGVSVQTVYNAVGGKAAVLKAVYDVMLAGDADPVPMIERPTALAMRAATDGRSCLALYARMGREIYERVAPLVPILLVEAGGGDREVRRFVETIEGERAIGTAGVARHVAERFGLRPGLSVEEAADVLWTLTSPDVPHRLVRRRGWSLDRWERWLGEAMADALLGGATVGEFARADREDVVTAAFDRASWEERWSQALREHGDAVATMPPNAYLTDLVGDVTPGRALDAGCGHGAETLWLAARGWQVTAVDFSATALAHARSTAEAIGADVAERVDWVEGDLATWTPQPGHFDLVVCLYVHVAGSVEEMVRRMAAGVGPGATMLLAGHRPIDPATGAATPAAGQVQVSVDEAVAALDAGRWEFVVAEDRPRRQAGTGVDAVVIARRLS